MKPPACQQCRTVGGGRSEKEEGERRWTGWKGRRREEVYRVEGKGDGGSGRGGIEGGGKRWMGWKERRQKVKKRGEGKREVGGRDEARRREGGANQHYYLHDQVRLD